MAIRLLIAEEHALVRQGLRVTFEDTDIEIIGEATTGEEAVRLASREETDVMLLGIKMADGGLDVLRRVKSEKPEMAVLIYSQSGRFDIQKRARELGASGYLSKRADAKELIDAICKSSRGEKLWPASHGDQEGDIS